MFALTHVWKEKRKRFYEREENNVVSEPFVKSLHNYFLIITNGSQLEKSEAENIIEAGLESLGIVC